MDTHSQLSLQKKLEDNISKNSNTIKSRVVEEALTCESIEYFFYLTMGVNVE